MMKKTVVSAINALDQISCPLVLKFFNEKSSLIVFTFHSLFLDEKEISSNVVKPLEGITTEHFRQFIEYYLNHDYTFISPNYILNGLDNDKKYILITFDDGYFNNQRALPILKEYKIPALFFISTNYVKNNKAFFWDVLYRERKKQGVSEKDIYLEHQDLINSKTYQEIETHVKNLFGEKALEPISDLDRPFTVQELEKFSRENYVFLGNHTSDHAALTKYDAEGIKSQILDAQNTLYDITGEKPVAISYPYGRVSNEVIKISKDIGLRLMFIGGFKKNYLPLNTQGDGSLCLYRVALQGNNKLIKQCEVFRSDITLLSIIGNSLKKTSLIC